MTMTNKERQAQPEYKAKRKIYDAARTAYRAEYYSRLEVKARRLAKQNAYNATPEGKDKTKARSKVRSSTPALQANVAAYNARTEVKAKRLLNTTRYNNTLHGRLINLMIRCSSNAKKAGRAFSITYEDLTALYTKQGGKCALTGWELTTIAKCKNTISLDRIDNDQGYTIDNIQLVATQANIAKNKWTEEEFIALCKAVSEKHS